MLDAAAESNSSKAEHTHKNAVALPRGRRPADGDRQLFALERVSGTLRRGRTRSRPSRCVNFSRAPWSNGSTPKLSADQGAGSAACESQSMQPDKCQKILLDGLGSRIELDGNHHLRCAQCAAHQHRRRRQPRHGPPVEAQTDRQRLSQRGSCIKQPQIPNLRLRRFAYGRQAGNFIGAPIIAQGEVRGVLIASVQPNAVLHLFSGLQVRRKDNIIAVVDQNKRVICRTLQNDYWLGKDFSHAKTVTAACKIRLKAR